MTNEYLWIGSDCVAIFAGVKDVVFDTWANGGTIAGELLDSDDVAVEGGDALTGEYKAGSNGDYYLSIPAAVTAILTAGDTYTIVATITVDGKVLVYRIFRIASHKRK